MLPPLIQALCDPSAYPHRPARVDMVQTHISYLLLAGDLVYKIKKPVDLGFLDFTTLEKRYRCCRDEVVLNRRLAPQVYVGVVEIVSRDGRYQVEGSGEVVEYAVKMRRLPQDRMMDVMLDRGQVARGHVDALIEVLIPFFHTAERGPHIDPYGSVEAIRFNTDENFAETREYVGEVLTAERYGDIMAYTNTFLRNIEAFETRVREGRIRDCHGDLHSANICLADQVVVYDCIEFNHRFRYSDVAADVAFLAMDLDFRGRADLANYFVREFSRRSGDPGLLAMLPFYKCYRAFVRGKISAFAYGQPEQRQEDRMKNLRLAKRYFALAHRYTGAYHRPHVAVIFGLSGTGKSTLAAKLGRELGWPVINSDRVRKELAGIAPTERPTEETARTLYSWEMTRKTYAAMMERAEELLAEGQSVLLDATFLGREMRDMVGDMARRLDAEVHFILCECPEDIIRDRLNLRAADPENVSDADWRIYLRQKETFDPAGLETLSDFIPVDTSGSLDWVAHELAERLV